MSLSAASAAPGTALCCASRLSCSSSSLSISRSACRWPLCRCTSMTSWVSIILPAWHWLLGVQSLMTLLTRQFAGSLSDRRGPKTAVMLGGVVSVIAGAIYLLSTLPWLVPQASLGILFAGRAGLGIGESLVMTGGLAWAIAAVGPQHTGKVMVWVGIAMYAAVAVGAPLGIYLMTHSGIGGGFVAVAWATMLFAIMVPTTAVFVPAARPHHGERLPFLKVAIRVAPFGAGLALATIGFGAMAAFAALDFQHRGWSGSGFALTGFGAAYILTRVLFGGWPDRFGGVRVAFWSLLIEAAGRLLWMSLRSCACLRWRDPHRCRLLAGLSIVRHRSRQTNSGGQPGCCARRLCRLLRRGLCDCRAARRPDGRNVGYPSVFAAGAVAAVAGLLVARRRRMS